MSDLSATSIKKWLGIDKHGKDWRRHAILEYRKNPLMNMAYKDLTDDEFIAMMEQSFEARRKRDA